MATLATHGFRANRAHMKNGFRYGTGTRRYDSCVRRDDLTFSQPFSQPFDQLPLVALLALACCTMAARKSRLDAVFFRRGTRVW